jgi:hypothetical protein
MYSRITLSDLDLRNIEEIEPGLKAIGYELQPEKMRPSVWEFEGVVVAGEGDAFCSRTDLASEMDVASPAKAREGELIQRTNTTSSAGACL